MVGRESFGAGKSGCHGGLSGGRGSRPIAGSGKWVEGSEKGDWGFFGDEVLDQD